MFKRGDKVVRILCGPGYSKSASLGYVVSKVNKKAGTFTVEDQYGEVLNSEFNLETGIEVAPAFLGMSNEVVKLEG